MKHKDKDLQHLAAIVRDSDDAIIGKTLEGIITSWNGGAERIYGYTAEEAIGRTVAMLVPPDREDELPNILQKLTQGEGINHYDTLRVTKDGRVVNISLTVSAIRDNPGALTGASSIGRDVTKEKEAEVALRESAGAYKLLMEQASDAILVGYPDQPLIEVNQRASDMLGYSREELLRFSKVGSILPEGLSAFPLRPDQFLEGDIVYSERPVQRKDGSVIVTELSARRLDDGRIVTIARDITGRKKTEEVLSQSEKRLTEAQKLAHLGSWEWDLVSNEATASEEMFRILGLDPQEFASGFTIETFIYALHPGDREWVQQAHERVIEERGSFSFDNRIVRPDGKVRILHALGEVILDEVGQPVRMIGTAQDVTESRHADEKLQFQAQVLDQVQASVIAMDLQGTITHWNPYAEKLYGWQSQEALGQPILSLMVGPTDANLAKEIMTRVRSEGSWEGEFTVQRKDGSTFPAFVVDTVILNQVGHPTGIVGISVDITERKRAEEQILQLASIVESSNDAIISTDPEGTIISWNAAATALYGYGADEVIGRSFGLLIPLDRIEVARHILMKLNPGERIGHFETRWLRKDATEIPVSVSISPILDATGHMLGASTITRGITTRKRVEEMLHPLSSEEARRSKSTIYRDLVVTFALATTVFLLSVFLGLFDAPIDFALNLLTGGELHDVLATSAFLAIAFAVFSYRRWKALTAQEVARKKAEEALLSLHDELELRVQERTTDLVMVNETLHSEITERKLVAEELQKREMQLSEAQEIAHVGSWEADVRTGEAIWSDELYLIFGVEPQGHEASFERFLEYTHPDDLGIVGKKIERAYAKGGSFEFNHRVLRPDGSVRVVSTRGKVIMDEDGRPFRVVGTAQDITERNQSERALKESEQRYKQMFQGNGSVQWLIDPPTGTIVEANQAASDFYGYSLAELKGMNIVDINNGLDAAQAKPLLERMSREAVTLVSRHTLASGEVRDIEARAGPIDIGGRRLIHSIITDVTEQNRAESARMAKEAAERANHAKSEFLSRMSHELRTPLNAILGFGQLLEMDDLIPEQQESVGYILKAGEHLLNLINEVLDIARIEEGKLSIDMEPVFVHDVLQESLVLVQPLAARRNIEMKADLAWMGECYVMADRQRLQQVVLNLLANAIKYNRKGGVVTVSCEEREPHQHHQGDGSDKPMPAHKMLCISVSDTGHGLSPDKVARLFTPFERLGAEQQGDVEGTGLGLALSKHLVEAMGGAIGVESEQGTGSTFWVELSPADEQVAPLEQMLTGPLLNIQVQAGEQAPTRTILHIEDNLSNLRLIERILRQLPGINLITAMQGQMGLDMAYEHSPDLILLDLHLPDMAGDEVLRRLQEDPRTGSTPVVMLSADANPRQVEKLLEAGARTYLTKPFDVKQLLEVLEESLATALSVGMI
jgi:PAS domain S-box-containing protein